MKSETMELHKKKLPIKVSCGIITLSDSLSKDSEGKKKDLSGQYIIDQVSEKYDADYYEIIPDDAQILLDTLEDMIEKGADAIFTTGGTGLEERDITIETLSPLFDGSLLSRATAGIYKKTLVFSMPGSPNAVEMGMGIIIGELGHIKKHAQK